MKIKILSINKHFEHKSINNNNFDTAPSFSDFDVVIIDPKNLSRFWTQKISPTAMGSYHTDTSNDGGFGRNMYSLFERRKEEIEELLKVSQGIVICYLRGHELPLEIVLRNASTIHKAKLTIYSWLPSYEFTWLENRMERSISFPYNVKFPKRTGEEIAFVEQSHPFSKYFYAFKKQIKFECIIKPDAKLARFLKVISLNKVKELVSCEIPIEGGKIIFLSPSTSQDSKKEMGVLFDCIEGVFEYGLETTPPTWVKKYSLPNENKNKGKIDQLGEKIGELQQKKQELEEEKMYISKFKGLLYEKGKIILEPLVREAFNLMGFNVVNPEQYKEEYDLYIKEKDLTIIGEVEGTDNSTIDVDKYRQLLDYVEAERDKGTECKGILIGNAFRISDIPERPEQFSEKAIRRSESQRFCRITTYQLFEIVKKIFSGIDGLKLEKLRKDITECNTEFIFKKKETKKAQETQKKK